MSYEVTYIPTEEKMKEYKPWSKDTIEKSEDTIKSMERSIISICMHDNTNKDTLEIEKNLLFRVRAIAFAVKQIEKNFAYTRWESDENHELWYTEHLCNIDEQEYINDTIDNLLVIADIVQTPDYFTNRDNFYELLTEIKEILSEFHDGMQDVAIKEIKDDLNEFKQPDGYDELREELNKTKNDVQNNW